MQHGINEDSLVDNKDEGLATGRGSVFEGATEDGFGDRTQGRISKRDISRARRVCGFNQQSIAAKDTSIGMRVQVKVSLRNRPKVGSSLGDGDLDGLN